MQMTEKDHLLPQTFEAFLREEIHPEALASDLGPGNAQYGAAHEI